MYNGWDVFEACHGSEGYDESWAGVNVYNPIESTSIMVYHMYFPAQYRWDYASAFTGCDVMDQWSSTPFSLTHYHASQYSNWIVRTPMIYIGAYETYYWYTVTAGVYIDGNWVGGTGGYYYLTPNVQHTITIDQFGYSNLWGEPTVFLQWNSGSYDRSFQTLVCGSDTSNTAYYNMLY